MVLATVNSTTTTLKEHSSHSLSMLTLVVILRTADDCLRCVSFVFVSFVPNRIIQYTYSINIDKEDLFVSYRCACLPCGSCCLDGPATRAIQSRDCVARIPATGTARGGVSLTAIAIVGRATSSHPALFLSCFCQPQCGRARYHYRYYSVSYPFIYPLETIPAMQSLRSRQNGSFRLDRIHKSRATRFCLGSYPFLSS
jgi:hypothetical protein